jgi:hypothetical protein
MKQNAGEELKSGPERLTTVGKKVLAGQPRADDLAVALNQAAGG